MVSVDHIKSVFLIKTGQKMEGIVVNIYDLTHISVFPQLIPISQLNISEAALIIMGKGGKV